MKLYRPNQGDYFEKRTVFNKQEVIYQQNRMKKPMEFSPMIFGWCLNSLCLSAGAKKLTSIWPGPKCANMCKSNTSLLQEIRRNFTIQNLQPNVTPGSPHTLETKFVIQILAGVDQFSMKDSNHQRPFRKKSKHGPIQTLKIKKSKHVIFFNLLMTFQPFQTYFSNLMLQPQPRCCSQPNLCNQPTHGFSKKSLTVSVLWVGVPEPICVAMLPAKDVPRHHRDLKRGRNETETRGNDKERTGEQGEVCC